MPRSNVAVIPENILQNLKCVKCSLYISVAPVSYDDNENLVCGRCQDPNSPLRRAKAFEAIQELLLFPCRYADNGCTKLVNSSQITSHEDICEYGSLQCPMVTSGECDWQGILLYEHCLEKHYVSSIRKSILSRISMKNGVKIIFLKYSTYLFVLNFLTDIFKKTMKCTAYQIIKNNNEQERFEKYHIRLRTVSGNSLNLEIRNFLYDYKITRLKQSNKQQIDIHFSLTDKINLDNIYFEFLIDNLTDKNAIVSKNLENFKCPKCSLFMKDDIIICGGGHSFCNECFRTSNICHICNKKCDGTRNIIFQNFAENTKFPCENEDQGCNYLGIKNDFINHKSICFYEKIVCPLKKITNCVWTGANKNHIHHLLANHEHKTLLSGEKYKHIILEEDTEDYWIICFQNAYFRCCYQESLANASFTWHFHQIGLSKNNKPSYKIEMEFINDDIEESSLIVGIPCYRFRNEYLEDGITIPYDCLSRYYVSSEGCGEKLLVRYNVIKFDF